ncbi:MAG: GWxTD domain-containing protein, partial [bacterium]
LPIPHQKLSLGTTTLKIIARHKDQNIASSLSIRSNFGYRPRSFKNFTILIGPMRFIMPKNEYEELVNATSEKQAELFNTYWRQRNPNSNSENNPLLEEFYYRVEMANARFGWTGGDGYATDRGHTIIRYGPPDAVQNTRRPGSTISYEIWSYYDLGRRFVFIDKYNDGNYQLLSDSGA